MSYWRRLVRYYSGKIDPVIEMLPDRSSMNTAESDVFVPEGLIDSSLARSAWEMWAQGSVPEGTV
jgi:hypothetical protein